MEPNEVLLRLFDGQKKIDVMRSQINWFVRQVAGFAREFLPDKKFNENFETDSCLWTVAWNRHRVRAENFDFAIACVLKSNQQEVYYMSHEEDPRLYVVNVHTVYQNLTVLVAGMMKRFPQLEVLWKPLIDASSVAIPSL
jgi:hypothetical protein